MLIGFIRKIMFRDEPTYEHSADWIYPAAPAAAEHEFEVMLGADRIARVNIDGRCAMRVQLRDDCIFSERKLVRTGGESEPEGMIKAKGKINGRDVLILALSHHNLERLRANGLNGYIPIAGKELGVPFDIHITAAATEKEILAALVSGVGPQTRIEVSDKAKEHHQRRARDD
jgi:hypothetical protein